jgi:magnesium chelatase family protein
MSYARLLAAETILLKPHLITVEVDFTRGLHSFSVVGLPDQAVEEARDRVASAVKNTGFKSPKQTNRKIVVSLAPAELKKSGAMYDLAIALGYLLAAEEIAFDPSLKLFLGELSLDGTLRKVSGVLPLVQHALASGIKEVFVPEANAKEAALVEGISISGKRLEERRRPPQHQASRARSRELDCGGANNRNRRSSHERGRRGA